MWDFGTIRPAYSRNATRPTANASGTMRVVHPGREPLQPLPAVQRPLTPPESQRHPPKYGGMAQPPSPRKDLQVCTREEMDLFDSVDSEYYDVEEGYDDDEDVVSASTVKIAERPIAVPSSGRQASSNVVPGKSASPPNRSVPPKSPSPSKAISHGRTSSQIPTPVQSQYTNTKSDVSEFPMRSSAASSTAYAPTSPSVVPAFGSSNLPSRTQLYKYNALEDILLPALEEVAPSLTLLQGFALTVVLSISRR